MDPQEEIINKINKNPKTIFNYLDAVVFFEISAGKRFKFNIGFKNPNIRGEYIYQKFYFTDSMRDFGVIASDAINNILIVLGIKYELSSHHIPYVNECKEKLSQEIKRIYDITLLP